MSKQLTSSVFKSYAAVSGVGDYDTLMQVNLETGIEERWNEDERKLASYSFIQWRFSKMLGKILTLIDASIGDKQQNKAIKDLIKGDFINEYGELSNFLLGKSGREPECCEEGMIELVSADKALGLK